MPDGVVHSAGVSDSAVSCPLHATPAAYWHAGDDWACTIPDCGYGYGIATATSAATTILTALRQHGPQPAVRSARSRWLPRRRRRARQ